MKFEEGKIYELIKANQTIPAWVVKARDYNVELDALVNGKNFIDLLIRVEHKEDEKKLEARRKYARSIKDMFERLLKPLSNVYSATGGSKKYPDNITPEVLEKISRIRDGKPLEKWLQVNWMNLYHADPNGVILYEWTDQDCYPVYKNISKIRNYISNGQTVEWILFEPVNLKEKNTRAWRFIDDAFDYQIIEVNGNFAVDLIESYANPFGVVPLMINSNLNELGSEFRKSPLDNIIGSAKEYLHNLSHKSMFKFLLWDPIFWRYAIKCNSCHGTGKKGTGDCPDCTGGYYVKKDITDCVTLPVPEEGEGLKLAPDIAGFIVPETKIMEEFNKELVRLYNEMESTLWGLAQQGELATISNQDKTAFQVYRDTQPQITALNTYADVAEYAEQWLTLLSLKYYIGPDVKGVGIFYGRNYILESQSALLERYETSRENGDNSAILDKQLNEWLLSKYKNDPKAMNEEKLRLQVEPYIHYTIEQVSLIYGNETAKKKMLFTEWWAKVEKTKKTVEQLIIEFNDYTIELLGRSVEKTFEDMNGAQITGLIQLMTAAGLGQIPDELVVPIINAAFPNMRPDVIAQIQTGLIESQTKEKKVKETIIN